MTYGELAPSASSEAMILAWFTERRSRFESMRQRPGSKTSWSSATSPSFSASAYGFTGGELQR